MSTSIPDSHKDLIAGPYVATLTTLSPQGAPENSVVWCSLDGDHVLVNTTSDRRKAKNIEKDPRVALVVIDPNNPWRWIDVRGQVEEVVEDVDYRNIDAHAKLYVGADAYYGGVMPAEAKGTENRVILRIKPRRVMAFPPQ